MTAMNRKHFITGLLAGAAFGGAPWGIKPASAQSPAPAPVPVQPKSPTPAPLVTAENSIIGPNYTPAPETAPNPNVPQGDVFEFIMYSDESRIYPGVGAAEGAAAGKPSKPGPYVRHVWVYIPEQYEKGHPAPFMVVQDGHAFIHCLAPVLDNLIAAGSVPAMIIVAADSGGGWAQSPERRLEYDTLSGRYSDWVEQELLPAVTRKYGVAFTKDPEGRGTMGGSSGGACAWTMAWFHPERYRKVLSYSGAFVNRASPKDPNTPRGAWEYHATLIPNSPPKPIRVWMEVGEKDLHFDDPESTWLNWPLASNRMAVALKKKGYDYRYVWALGAHNVDSRVVMQTLPAALEWLWRDYPRS